MKEFMEDAYYSESG